MKTSSEKEYKYSGANILRFTIGKKEIILEPGKTASLPPTSYVQTLEAKGLIKEVKKSTKKE